MTRDEIKNLLDSILDKEFENLDIPTAMDWAKIERRFGCQFPNEFRYFIELMSEYVFPGDILNVSLGKTNGNDSIEFTYDYEMKKGDWNLLSNECSNTGVYYYSHEENKVKKEADNFNEWLLQLPTFLS